MDRVCAPRRQVQGLVPYDPKYLPAKTLLSANENPEDVDSGIRKEIKREIKGVKLNRYPDPLATDLRDMIAEANGLDRDCVLIGNGGDELLFNTALAWGGSGRAFLNLPPTFSAYEANARLMDSDIVNVPRIREQDYAIDKPAVLKALADPGLNITYAVIASPNNPTGLRSSNEFIGEVLDATDALILVDEAYFEFSRQSARWMLDSNKNLVILRTFSKAFSLAGVRIGYVLANPEVIDEYKKVRQPYSVDAVSQAIGRVVFRNRAKFGPGIQAIIEERKRVDEKLRTIPGVHPYPSDSNWILFSVEDAANAWEYLYGEGILVRDFSSAPYLENTLRVTIGTSEQNDAFLTALRNFVMKKD